MSKTISLLLTLFAVAVPCFGQMTTGSSVTPATPQASPTQQMNGGRPRLSPHETVSAKIDGNRVSVTYGRPYAKDPKSGKERTIWGDLVPYAKVWRTGSDEATIMITQKPIMFGGVTVPAGAYTLFTKPAADGSAKLIINRQIGQWGIDPYDATQELAEIDMKKEATSEPVEQFTMSVGKNPSGGGVIKMMWANTQYSAAYTLAK